MLVDGHEMTASHSEAEQPAERHAVLPDLKEVGMTNRELLIKSLSGELDDWAAEESNIAYNIACPYYGVGIEDAHPCEGMSYPWDKLKVCGPCITEWLDKEAGA